MNHAPPSPLSAWGAWARTWPGVSTRRALFIAAVRDSHHRAAELKALVNMVMNINCTMTG
ncbi:MAG: hypothetical protein ACOYOL_10070 [Chthoniobacterales bacterium]